MTLLVVGAGGALGAIARYVVGGWVQSLSGGYFPWGTFVVNAIGSFALGFSLTWLDTILATAELRLLVAVGFLGAFTTFSTFSYEALAMLRDGEWLSAGAYVVGSVVLGLLAVVAGAVSAAWLLPGLRA